MNTKLTRLFEAIIEAGWLAALVITPLFFNVHSSRVFEPDKLSLLRSIALIMVVAWLGKLANEGFGRAARAEASPSFGQRLRSTPLVLPTLALVVVYLISTALSVSPRISWWGSYQRLQGTYTTLSYIVIFFLVLGHLRRREQWDRMAYAMILTSLPISIYGIIQRSGIDPLPWGGNVQTRVASNMGNSIFVAAYLLMVIFLTLQRALVHFGRLLRDQGAKPGLADAVLAGAYLFILVVQSLTLLFTQSRGPFLGVLAGGYVFGLVGMLGLRAWAGANPHLAASARGLLRWGWVAVVLMAAAITMFLVVFNLPNSPLATLRTNPYIGRLGTALDLESNTARVRTLIWEGTVDLLTSDEPLAYPTTGGQGDVTQLTPDPLHVLRLPFGYGPETMWVAFNRYYPPDLAHHESRNASPDRAHNETFDSLVITGVLGFLAYIALFVSVFYYCLKWLGLIRSSRQRLAFVALTLAGGVVGGILPYLVQGSWILFGLGLPTGLIIGAILYITGAAIWNESKGLALQMDRRSLLLMTILATVVAHFVEINFGIAIASTRTYFWVWSAVLVVVGMSWLRLDQPVEEPATAPVDVRPAQSAAGRSKSAKSGSSAGRAGSRPTARVAHPARPARQDRWIEVSIYGVLLGLILFTIAYDFVINPNAVDLRSTNPFAVFWNAFTTRVVKGERVGSGGILWMVLFTWLVGLLVALFSLARRQEERLSSGWLARAALLYSAVGLGIFLAGGLLHAAGVAGSTRMQSAAAQLSGTEQLDLIAASVARHIAFYYAAAFLLGLLLAALVWRSRPGEGRWLGPGRWAGPLAAAGSLVVALVFISRVNLNLVQADVIYKIGQAYDNAKQYDGAVYLYQKAIEKQPQEDYYYLFLGRAQLEQARKASGAEQQQYLRDAEQSLLRAQALNPLNTDHSANLARLYISESQMVTGAQAAQALQRSLDYYQVATTLSPNAAHLHNEYGSAYLAGGDSQKALDQLTLSLSLDQRYSDTYRRLGDLYQTTGQTEQAIEAYRKALEIRPKDVSLHNTLGYLYAQQGDLAQAIEQNLAVLSLRPDDRSANRNLAVLYQQVGDPTTALVYAQKALELAQGADDKAALQALIEQLKAQIGG